MVLQTCWFKELAVQSRPREPGNSLKVAVTGNKAWERCFRYVTSAHDTHSDLRCCLLCSQDKGVVSNSLSLSVTELQRSKRDKRDL